MGGFLSWGGGGVSGGRQIQLENTPQVFMPGEHMRTRAEKGGIARRIYQPAHSQTVQV